ncbi:unnamed protein product [Effrenium voratum]|uniref:SLC41A/MgtE integral membrane domain-containing protein n=1 Tax=Effrenium voratum TaxID=2562239 RepID=A0AA36IE07_9DINO|nr:unnamed protein product [Effrenium voratum]
MQARSREHAMEGNEEELGLLAEFGSDPDVGAGPPPPEEDAEMRHRGSRAKDPSTSRVQNWQEEEGSSATLQNFGHRAGWLVLLLLCQSSSSFILQRFEFLIKSHPTVIYFLTMLVGAGGNAGGQSTVLVVRRLALAGKRNSLSFHRIVGSEILVGAKLAIVLFAAAFLRCAIFKVFGAECIAICLSMFVIVFTSTALGAALPLFLSHLGLDPAHAGATIQVVMDVSGVALTCVISSAVLGFKDHFKVKQPSHQPWDAGACDS